MPKINYVKSTFSEMFAEIHKRMWKINKKLKSSHPFASTPSSWPALERGISFWGDSVGKAQIYLIGNPIVWWLFLAVVVIYVLFEVARTVLAQRAFNLNQYGKFTKFIFR
jgi:dolichyl-phosphate-mannose-protein mannosyltransferase